MPGNPTGTGVRVGAAPGYPPYMPWSSRKTRTWKVRGYPTSFVVGPDGRIRYYYVGELDWARDDVVRTIEKIR